MQIPAPRSAKLTLPLNIFFSTAVVLCSERFDSGEGEKIGLILSGMQHLPKPPLSEADKAINWRQSQVRAKAEHPFPVLK
jgi:hypothetical protein